MQTTRHYRQIQAKREKVYQALIDPVALAQWRVPDGMSSEVHEFEPWEGGRIRVSLTYTTQDAVGKSGSHTDTYRGTFIRLVPGVEVVEVNEFETADPAMQGAMRITISLSERDGVTELRAVHEGLPDAVPAADNELGWNMALEKLAALVEGK